MMNLFSAFQSMICVRETTASAALAQLHPCASDYHLSEWFDE